MIFVKWEEPRRWTVRLYKKYSNRGGGYHSNVGVVAYSVDKAIEAAQLAYPDSRIESVNDTGVVHIVVDPPPPTNTIIDK